MRDLSSIVICALLASPMGAAVIRVPEEIPTIEGALDAAAPGDTIIVSAGEYAVASPLRFAGKGVMLSSAEGPAATRIRKGFRERGEPLFLLDGGEGRDAVIRGFAMDNPYGPGVQIRGSSPTIEGNWFLDSDREAISCEGGSPRVIGGRLEFCTGLSFKRCDAEVEGIETGRYSGGLRVLNGRLVVRSRRLVGCAGPGISARSSELRIEGCLLAGNSRGGAEGFFSTGSIIRTTIAGNGGAASTQPIVGGGVHGEGGSLSIEECIIFGNVRENVVDVRLVSPISSLLIGFSDIGEAMDEIGAAIPIDGREGNIRRAPRSIDFGMGVGINGVPGDFRLRPDSPCIHAGNPSPASADPDGTPPEMGAFPFEDPDAGIDADGDGMPDWWERRHGLEPEASDGGCTATAMVSRIGMNSSCAGIPRSRIPMAMGSAMRRRRPGGPSFGRAIRMATERAMPSRSRTGAILGMRPICRDR